MIDAKNILQTKKILNNILATACNKDIKDVELDTDRDYYMSAGEAKEYGLIDEIIVPKKR